MKNKWYHFN